MDSNQAAAVIGTTPRTLRQFLRSPSSTFVAVGSGARYEFTDRDIPTLRKRFSEWAGAGRQKPSKPPVQVGYQPTARDLQLMRDQEVWAEEGPVVLPDIRDPRVLAHVRQVERERNEQLDLLLLSKGLHITQVGDRR